MVVASVVYESQVTAMFAAYIPNEGREPICIAITNTWEPTRVRTPRFMDAWSTYKNQALLSVPVLLGKYCKNVVVWRTKEMTVRQRQEFYVDEGKVSFSRVFAKYGSGRDDYESTEQ